MSLLRVIKNAIRVGPKEVITQLWHIGDVKYGVLVGADQFGNKYYENKDEIFGRDRWVDYSKHYYDGSQIPAEWHRWIHRITDNPPTVEPPPSPKFKLPHTDNLTGTRKAYKPYSTTAPKISAWTPSVGSRVQ